jgi:hypothetical protein
MTCQAIEPDQAQSNRFNDGVKDAGEAWKEGVDDAFIEPAVGSIGVPVEVIVGLDASGRDVLNEINKALGKDPNYFDRWYHKDRIKRKNNPGDRSVKRNGITRF